MHSRLFGLFVCLAAGCAPDRQDTDTEQARNPAERQQESFRKQLLEIAGKYKSFRPANGMPRWAPVYCRAPMEADMKIRLSLSDDEMSHGRKLYFLFAAQIHEKTGEYLPSRSYPDLIAAGVYDHVIVKESWVAKPCEPDKQIPDGESPQVAKGNDGKHYRAGEKGPLFVMFQTAPDTPGTDDGWVYGTLTPDGKTVTSVGRLENCMSCHQKAPHGRLFGLPKD